MSRVREDPRVSLRTMLNQISFARGAPSVDIIAVDDLKSAAQRAFENDPAGTFSYGTSTGYPPLRSGSPPGTT